MFGLANELCGENGLGWARRLMIMHSSIDRYQRAEDHKQGARFLAREV